MLFEHLLVAREAQLSYAWRKVTWGNGGTAPWIFNLAKKCKWSNSRFGHFTTWEKSPRYALCRRTTEHHSRSGCFAEEKNTCYRDSLPIPRLISPFFWEVMQQRMLAVGYWRSGTICGSNLRTVQGSSRILKTTPKLTTDRPRVASQKNEGSMYMTTERRKHNSTVV